MYATNLTRLVRHIGTIILIASVALGCSSTENKDKDVKQAGGNPLKGVADVIGGTGKFMIEGTGTVVGGAGAIVLNSGVVLGEAIGEVLLIPFGPSLAAPNFTLQDLQGNMVSLKDFKDKPVILVFWEPIFSSCQAEMVHLEELHKKYEPKGLKVIGIALPYNQQFSVTQKFVKKAGLTYPILKGNEKVLNLYTESDSKVKKLPVTIFINREGNIVKRQIGFTSVTMTTGEGKFKRTQYIEVNNRFEEEIQKLLEK